MIETRRLKNVVIFIQTIYHNSINKKPINVDYYAFIENIQTNPKASKFKVSNRVRITKYKNIFSKDYTKN